MSSNRYKYQTLIDGAIVNPMWEKNTAKVYDRLQGRVFHRETLGGGGIDLLRPDNLVVQSASLDHKFDLAIQRRNDAGTYDNYMLGDFYKTDCEINEDRRQVKIAPKPMDRYNKILADYDKEFDLVQDLAPPVHSVRYVKVPNVQIAIPWHLQIFNIVGISHYITELSSLYTSAELQSFGFTPYGQGRLFIPGSGDMVPDVSGFYEQSLTDVYTREDGLYYIQKNVLINQWHIYEDVGLPLGVVRYSSTPGEIANGDTPLTQNPFDSPLTFLKDGDPDVKCKAFNTWLHQRILTDATTINSNPTIPVPTDDIGGVDFGYDNYIDVSGAVFPYPVLIPSDEHSAGSTRFGRFSEDSIHFAGEFFNPDPGPFVLIRPSFYVFQESWTEYCMVAYIHSAHVDELEEARSVKTLRHAYKYQDVLRALLSKIDPSIVFLDDVNYSEFLFSGTNPVTGDVQAHTHFITPKTNIIVDDYDNPTSKAPITLAQLDELMRNGLDLHWWIDPSYMLQYEHISYFNNGRSYLGQVVSNNLTIQENPQNSLPWAYRTKSYKYKKETMPERFEYNWMDKSNDAFDGFPIEMISGFVEKGNVETRAITNFTSDINQINAANDGISKDGFCIMKATPVDGVFIVDYDDVNITGSLLYSVQNGYWSFMFLHPRFHKHNLPAPAIKVNDTVTTAASVKRARVQEIIYPSPIEPDVMRLITTSLGTGEIERMSVNLTTRAVTITVLHDNE